MRLLPFLLLPLLVATAPARSQQASSAVHRFFNNFEDSVQNALWMNPNTIRTEEVPNNRFSMTDSSQPYSSGIEITIPEDLKRKNFSITINALIRTSGMPFHGQLVISVADADSVIAWKGFVLPDSISGNNNWDRIGFSTLLPRYIPPDSRIKIFLWNDGGKTRIDLDEFEILFMEEKFPSFWPTSTK